MLRENIYEEDMMSDEEHQRKHERGTDKIAQANTSVRTYAQEEHKHTCIWDVCRKETAERFGALT